MSRSRIALVLVLTAALGCSRDAAPVVTPVAPQAAPETPAAPAAPPLFADMTAASGVDLVYRNGERADHYAILESLGGGVAMLDYDADGRLDLYFPGGGEFAGADKRTIVGLPGKLYRNLGGARFADATAAAGLDKSGVYSHGAAVADIDLDGFPDLLVTGYGGLRLYRNVADAGGGRAFRDATAGSGLDADRAWSTSAAFGDLDGDGDPDLYVCHYVNWSWENHPPCAGYSTRVPRDVCPPKVFGSVPHMLFRNDGGGKFVDMTAAAGLRVQREDKDYGKGLGVLFADVNADGKPDIYVCNDTTDNFLYVNRTEGGALRFEDVGFSLGVARDGNGVPNGSMGVDAGDYEGTGRPALWVTNYENEFHALYRNLSARERLIFSYGTPAAGLGAIGPIYVGFGTAFVDADMDGWEDIVIANGHVIRYPPRDNLAQPPVLFRNVGGGGSRRKFVNAPERGGPLFAEGLRSRGLGVGDLDDDGYPDLAFAVLEGPARVARHTGKAGGAGNWLGIDLRREGHQDVVGATVRVTAGGVTRTRFARGGGSYLSSGDRRLAFGLGDLTEAAEVVVEWPSGEPRRQTWTALPAGKYHTLTQGK